jgi:hypothetical protein
MGDGVERREVGFKFPREKQSKLIVRRTCSAIAVMLSGSDLCSQVSFKQTLRALDPLNIQLSSDGMEANTWAVLAHKFQCRSTL